MGFGSVLVANRGEIAVRLVRAARVRGLRAVAVYTDADASARHVAMADEAVRVPSYLDGAALLGAASETGAEAVHPGYGLLSEDAGFAAAVRDKGLTFVGPDAEVIATMGDKVAARSVAQRCGVPVLAGGTEADEVGFPLLVKAVHGGGGRGMRVVRSPAELDDARAAAAREATAAFGRGEVFLERYLERPRHVEVQVVGDAHGTVVALGDRDCSVQRRHQKLLEEAPAPALTCRPALQEAAVRLAREVGYVGVGTVEFLVGADGEWAFLEMNTRLQVEHGVTELVTGLDLVDLGLHMAAGAPLELGSVVVTGHAIQARVAAEDPWSGFLPAPGTLRELRWPAGPWVRVDAGYGSGDTVPGAYDSLLGKVHAWGPDRATARARLAAALDELVVEGVATTAPYLRTVLAEPDYVAVTHDTGSLERDWLPDPATRPAGTTADEPSGAPSSGAPSSGAPSSGAPSSVRRVEIATDAGPVTLAIPVHGASRRARVASRRVEAATTARADEPRAPMDAAVVEVRAAVGGSVRAGDVLVVLEAMKMELPVRAARDATVDAVHVAPGQSITAGTELVSLS